MTFHIGVRCALLFGVPLAACQVPLTLDFPVGPLSYEVSFDELSDEFLSPELFGTDVTVAELSCDSGGCPIARDQDHPQVGCDRSDLCNPEPYTFELDLPPVDLGEFDDLRRLGDRVTQAEVRRLRYLVEQNTVDVPLPTLTLYWGPETAAEVADESARLLGTLPGVDARQAPTGLIELDAEGQNALAQHFVETSTVFRLFATATVDLEPKMPIPQGTLRVVATMDVHLEGDGGRSM